MRSSVVLKIGLGLAVVAVIALAYVDLRREEARALDDFVSEQQALARSAGASMSARTESLFTELELAARTGVSPRAKVITEDGIDGAVVLPGEGKCRVFRVHEDGRTAELDLDLDQLFAASEQAVVATSVPQGRLVFVDEVRPTALGPGDALRFDDPEVGSLLERMRAGESGVAILGRAASDSLGLSKRISVAGYAPVTSRVGRWSVAFVRSARRVRDRARLAGWRLLAASGIAVALVTVFGLVLNRRERRQLELEKQLEVSDLRERARRDLVRAEKLSTIGTLAAGVAHEVGTPLGIISGRAEQLLERTQDEQLRKPLTSILAQVDKVGKTIRQLLDFARVRPIEAQAIGPAQALEGAAALLEHRFRQHAVQLDIDASPTLATVSADPGQLEQVLVNLLVNACDACKEGGHVRARASEIGDRIALEISDDGVGIAAESLPLVLDPFFTTKKRGQGTGLGLSIVADIVKNHGGTLEIDSAPGAGTTVRVCLPVALRPGPRAA